MSTAQRISLESGSFKNDNGSGVSLGLTFTSEQDLDKNLWLDPEAAGKDLRYLLKVHQGEITPAFSRIALKGIAHPLFMREFYGEETSADIIENIRTIPHRNSQLLDAYLDRVGNENVDQTMLKQAIDDTTILQLVSRSLTSPETEDVILLPIGPQEDSENLSASFTVLRRKSLGRALLFVSGVRPTAYIHTPQANPHRIHIRPADLVSNEATRFDLAEALIAEQLYDAINPDEVEMIKYAETHVHDAITRHFDRIQPQA